MLRTSVGLSLVGILLSSCSSAPHRPFRAAVLPVVEGFQLAWASRYPEFGSSRGYRQFDSEAVRMKDDMDSYDHVLLSRWKVKVEHELAREPSDLDREKLEEALDILDKELTALKRAQAQLEVAFYPATRWVYSSLAQVGNAQDRRARFEKFADGQEVFRPFVEAVQSRMDFQRRKYGKKALLPWRSEIEAYLRESPEYLQKIRGLLSEAGNAESEEEQKRWGNFSRQAGEYEQYLKKHVLPNARKSGATSPPSPPPRMQRSALCEPHCLSKI